MIRDYYELPKPGWLMRFFWRCAGADKYLLERATYTDQVKYLCLGGIVMATGVLAGIAGGYAFYTIFAPKSADVLNKTKTLVENSEYVGTDTATVIVAAIFGVLWGLMIFNIDRFIVTSTGKGDGTEKITWDEFKGAIPRIVMGMIIAITISKPVEIRMFKTEIDLAIKEQQDIAKRKGVIEANALYEQKVAEVKKNLGKVQGDIDKKEIAISNLREEISKEITGKNENGAAYGPRAAELERQANILEKQIRDLKGTTEYKEVVFRKAEFEKQKFEGIKDAELKAATLDGLLIRIQKAHEIAGWTITIFITLLFMAIELTPIFFKLMLTKTPYDYLSENRDELIKAEHGIETRYDFYKDKLGQERHLTINHQAEKVLYEKAKIIEVQRELSGYAIEKYRDQEKEKIDKNPADYVQTA
ncbi:DUF4407 domain-containing protein [Dyadobacter sp. MSC1_007]|jgi:hypothetical protein|uniref:DUF4407 domain-containing protein n=1 Tax=Dyadobacter sp. MSC1_007 TaxID=2909264 RepID=UPI00202E83BB|nr:DUF4407 domain-containing protein [Dyadobacter sp. MSC1_007]